MKMALRRCRILKCFHIFLIDQFIKFAIGKNISIVKLFSIVFKIQYPEQSLAKEFTLFNYL